MISRHFHLTIQAIFLTLLFAASCANTEKASHGDDSDLNGNVNGETETDSEDLIDTAKDTNTEDGDAYHAGFSISGISSPAKQWVAEDIAITAIDQFGEPYRGYTGTVDFVSSAGGATILPSKMVFESGDNGHNSMHGVVIFQIPSAQTITVRDIDDATLRGTSSMIIVDPFDPTETSDAILWLDASDAETFVESEGKVSQWTDKSGSGDAIQSNVAQMPTLVANRLNGRSVLRFDGAQTQWMNVDLGDLANSNYTIFAVAARLSAPTGPAMILSSTNTLVANEDIHFGWRDDTSFTASQSHNDLNIPSPSFANSTADFVLMQAQLSSSGHELSYANLDLVSNDNTDALTSCTAGTIGNFTNESYFHGDIAEILVFGRDLTDLEVERIKLYLAEKWGLPYRGENLNVYAPWMAVLPTPTKVALLNSNIGNDSFLANQYSGLRLWVDASDSSTVQHDSNYIISWLDKSGQGNHLIGHHGPVYTVDGLESRATVDLGGGKDYFSLDGSGFSAKQIFSLHRFDDSSPSNAAIISAGPDGKNHFGRCGNSDSYCGNHLGGNTNFTYLGGSLRIDGFEDNEIGYGNYELVSAESPTPKFFDQLWVGETNDSPTHNWNGSIAELIIFEESLAERQQILLEDYFDDKWFKQETRSPATPFFTQLSPFEEKIQATWQSGGGSEVGFLLMKSTLPITMRPEDGVTYNKGETIEHATVVYTGEHLFTTDENIIPGSSYYYALFSFNQDSRYSRAAMRSIVSAPPYPGNGMMLWLDGTDPTTLYLDPECSGASVTSNGQHVACWKDKSGNDHHAKNSNPDQTPTYQKTRAGGLGAIQFDGINDHFADIFAANTQNKTIFVVFAHDHDGKGKPTGPLYQNNDVGNSGFFPRYQNGLQLFFTHAWTQKSSEFGRNVYQVATARHGTTISQLFKNGQISSQTAQNGTHTDGFFQIASRRVQNQYFRGDIAELIYYNRALDDAERKRVESYLMDKWGRSPKVVGKNLVLWLDAADTGTLTQTVDGLEMPVGQDGQKVQLWRDKSGNGRSAVQSSYGTAAPEYSTGSLNGKPCVVFDGDDDYLEGNLSMGTEEATLIVLHNRHSVNNHDRIFSVYKKADGLAADWNSPNGFTHMHEGFWRDNSAADSFQISPPVTKNTWYLDIIDLDHDSGSFWRNGVLAGTDEHSITDNINADTFRVSAGSDGISHGNNLICEILLYNKKLSVAERLSIQDYLYEKWTRIPTKPKTPNYGTLAPFDGEILSRWLPGGGNETGYLLARSIGEEVSWAPADGTAYTAGPLDANQSLVYVGSDTSYIDSEVTDDQDYYYALYAFDSANNYSPASTRQTRLVGISGLTVRLVGSHIEGIAGDKVATWSDSAGDNDANQETEDKQPTLEDCPGSVKCVVFDGVDDELTLGDLSEQFPSEASFYVVAWPYNDPHYNLFHTHSSIGNWWRYHGNGFSYPGMFRSPRIEAYGSVVMPSNGPAVWSGHSNATTWQMWVSGKDLGSTAGSYSPGDNYVIGGPDSGGAGQFLHGAIYEIVLFNHTLTADEKAAMDNYVREKYGLKLSGSWW